MAEVVNVSIDWVRVQMLGEHSNEYDDCQA